MSKSTPSAGLQYSNDPRTRPDFLARYYPTANGQPAPPVDGASDQNDSITLQFLAVYYDLNCKFARLREVQQPPESPRRRESENAGLKAIEETLIQRDQLEDFYAPYGVIAEPSVEDGLTVDVIFAFGNVDARRSSRSEPIRFAAHLSIPLPGEVLEMTPVGASYPEGGTSSAE